MSDTCVEETKISAEVSLTNDNVDETAVSEKTEIKVDSVEVKTTENNESDSKSENKTSTKADDDENNPYAYLDRNHFTSEKFKIEIRGLPKYYGLGELKKLLNNKLKLSSNKVKAPGKNKAWAYVCFKSQEEKLNAIKVLNGYRWKGSVLSTSDAMPAPDPLVMKRKENADNFNSEPSKRARIVDNPEEDQEIRLKECTIPLWDMPYEEQLKLKREKAIAVLKKIGNKLSECNKSLEPWLKKQRAMYEGGPCQLIDVRSATPIDGYRNKCEFTVGANEYTGKPTVGFRLGRYTTGVTAVASPDGLRHVPDRMKEAVRLFEKFVQASDLVPFDPETRTGHFYNMGVRKNSAGTQLMIIIAMYENDITPERLEQFKKQLTDFFVNGDGSTLGVTSLYYRRSNERTNEAELLHGEPYIRESLLGLQFRISPSAFFQINTPAAEVLYKSAIELAAPTSLSYVVDVCCGTGTIGLCFAKSCAQVLGIERDKKAVEDAKVNAQDNGIDNCEFFAGTAEEILGAVVRRATGDQIIAIVDPPRAGLHLSAIKHLRSTERLDKLVFVACDAAAAMKNFVDLGRPPSKTLRGEPLLPTKALLVDLFPHTMHFELLILFERYSKEKFNVD